MACGLPVLLTPGCNFPEVAEAGAGLVVQREVSALSTALTDLLTGADRRDRMGRAARDLIHARFTWPQVVRRLEDVYRMVMDRKK
jgi:glycosyltransferase involved in cell wall biosynthesis